MGRKYFKLSKRHFKGVARRRSILGAKLDRATAALPISTYLALFNIVNGRVLLTSIVGEVTTAPDGGANNTKITATPASGTALDISTTVDTNADQIGCLWGITGVLSGAMVAANAGATVIPGAPVVLQIGTVGVTTDATKNGSIKWTVTYIPFDDDGEMTVA